MPKTKIVFDLDYTLLDTVEFKEALAEAVTSCGPSRERYEETYKACVKREGKVYDYDPDVHLQMLRDDFASKEAFETARQRIGEVLTSTEKHLYPGAAELLKELRRNGAGLVLMTLGNERWQRAKVEHSGLKDYFDEVIATEKEKKGIIKGFGADAERVIIVNDNGAETKEMMAEAPEYTYVIKKGGPKDVPKDLGLKEGGSMKDIARILSEETGWEIDIERKGEGRDAEMRHPASRR